MRNSPLDNLIAWLILIPISLIILFFLLLFPYGLYIHTLAFLNGLTASLEWGGEPGTVTLLGKGTISTSRGEQTKCLGKFISSHGGTSQKVIVHTPNTCERNKTLPARFIKGQNTILSGLEQDTAWIKGSKDWIPNLLLVILFMAMTIISILPILFIARSRLKKTKNKHIL